MHSAGLVPPPAARQPQTVAWASLMLNRQERVRVFVGTGHARWLEMRTLPSLAATTHRPRAALARGAARLESETGLAARQVKVCANMVIAGCWKNCFAVSGRACRVRVHLFRRVDDAASFGTREEKARAARRGCRACPRAQPLRERAGRCATAREKCRGCECIRSRRAATVTCSAVDYAASHRSHNAPRAADVPELSRIIAVARCGSKSGTR